jgi:hypothetical protein
MTRSRNDYVRIPHALITNSRLDDEEFRLVMYLASTPGDGQTIDPFAIPAAIIHPRRMPSALSRLASRGYITANGRLDLNGGLQ